MSLDDALGAALDARLAPLRQEVRELKALVEQVRRALPPSLVSLKQAAEHLGISISTARRAAGAGQLPARRVGRRLMVDLMDLRPLSNEKVTATAHCIRALRPRP
jgi:excisionase family DNA binding protein